MVEKSTLSNILIKKNIKHGKQEYAEGQEVYLPDASGDSK